MVDAWVARVQANGITVLLLPLTNQRTATNRQGKSLRLFLGNNPPTLLACRRPDPPRERASEELEPVSRERTQKHCQIHFKLNLVFCLAKLLITKECLSADEKLHWGFSSSSTMCGYVCSNSIRSDPLAVCRWLWLTSVSLVSPHNHTVYDIYIPKYVYNI